MTTNPLLVPFTLDAVRGQGQRLLDAAIRGELRHVGVDLSAMAAASARVMEMIRATYPDLQILPYGCWRQFEAGGFDRWTAIGEVAGFETAEDLLVSAADLAAMACVLQTRLPADWAFEDPIGGTLHAGLEGQALAALAMFASGYFSSNPHHPFRVDADALIRLEVAELAAGLQWDPERDGELLEQARQLLKRFGEALALRPDLYGRDAETRPGLLLSKVLRERNGMIGAGDLFDDLIQSLAPVWPEGANSGDLDYGDAFEHSPLEGKAQIVPFHNTAQRIAYSWVEPLAWAGCEMDDLELLTAPADDVHAALFLDLGVLQVGDTGALPTSEAESDRMIEIRAVAAALTERLADDLRRSLDVVPGQLPLTCILEGGTSRVGREFLREKPEAAKKLAKIINPKAVFWLPFGA